MIKRDSRSPTGEGARPEGEGTGFTLWELLVTLSLMGFLLTMLTLHYTTSVQAAKARIQGANIRKIEGAVQVYRLDMGSFPLKLEDLITPPSGSNGWQGPYLKQWPVNPWEPEKAYRLGPYGQVLTSP